MAGTTEGLASLRAACGRVMYSKPGELASRIDSAIRGLRVKNTPSVRALRRRLSKELSTADGEVVVRLAKILFERYGHRWVAYELIAAHKPAFRSIGETDVEILGRGINNWWTVDAFGRILSGPAWLAGQISDALILKWARSRDLWWRRAAVVSTVALNLKADGGQGDPRRTLRICRILAKDREDMVVKALSWALRALAVPCPNAVRGFLKEHDSHVAALVKREVGNKLRTGLKNPR